MIYTLKLKSNDELVEYKNELLAHECKNQSLYAIYPLVINQDALNLINKIVLRINEMFRNEYIEFCVNPDWRGYSINSVLTEYLLSKVSSFTGLSYSLTMCMSEDKIIINKIDVFDIMKQVNLISDFDWIINNEFYSNLTSEKKYFTVDLRNILSDFVKKSDVKNDKNMFVVSFDKEMNMVNDISDDLFTRLKLCYVDELLDDRNNNSQSVLFSNSPLDRINESIDISEYYKWVLRNKGTLIDALNIAFADKVMLDFHKNEDDTITCMNDIDTNVIFVNDTVINVSGELVLEVHVLNSDIVSMSSYINDKDIVYNINILYTVDMGGENEC